VAGLPSRTDPFAAAPRGRVFAIERKPGIPGRDILRNANLHTDNADTTNAPLRHSAAFHTS
jgi:hypothetical protein